MLYLLKLEWLKLRHYNLFLIVVIAYLVLMPLTVLLFQIPGDPPDELAIPSFFMFPYIWESLGYAGNWISFFLFGFLAILMMSNEYSYKTFRQNVMTGLTRSQFLSSKLVMFATISILAALYFGLVGLIFGYFHTDYIKNSAQVLDGAGRIPRFALMTFGYMSFAFMIATIVRRSGLALLIYTIYTIILELVLRYWVHRELFGINESFWFYPMNVIEDLVYPDFFKIAEVSDEIQITILDPPTAIMAASVYIAIFVGIPFLVIRKRDL